MIKVKITKKIIVFGIILVLQVLSLINIIVDYDKSTKEPIYIPYKEILGTTIPDDRGGWYVDNSFPLLESGMFDYTEGVELKKGTYKVTVSYETDSVYNYSTVRATTKNYWGLAADKTPLQRRLPEVTYTVYLYEDVNDFSVENYYGRDGYLIIKDISITPTSGMFRIELFSWFFICGLINVCFLLSRKENVRRTVYDNRKLITVILIGGIFASVPIWDATVCHSQDCGFHLLRIEGIKEGLLSGQFPVKMQSNWIMGYGYPVSLYYGDLFLLLPAFLRIVGFSVQFSYNCFLLVVNIATVAVAYYCSSKVSKDKWISCGCAMLYTLNPYRLTDLYYRNAVGEATAIIFLPLIVYGMWAVFTYEKSSEKYKKLWIPLVIGFTGIIESHMLSCIMCGIFIIITCLTQIRKVFEKERFFVLLKTVIYTSLLNAWFIFPCLLCLNDGIDVTQPYRYIIRIQEWGAQVADLFGFLQKGDASIFGIGLILGIGLALFLYLLISQKGEKQDRIQGFYMWIFAIITLYMSTIYFPWNYLSELLGKKATIISNIQFPTRWLIMSAVFAMFATCYGLMILKKDGTIYKIIVIGMITLTVLSAEYSMKDGMINGERTNIYDITQIGGSDNNTGEYLLHGTDTKLLVVNLVQSSENVIFSNFTRQEDKAWLECINSSMEEGYVEFPILYYKQYVVKDENGNQFETEPGTNNVLRVMIPSNYSGTLSVRYIQPFSWRVFEGISLLFALGLIGTSVYQKRKRNNRE